MGIQALLVILTNCSTMNSILSINAISFILLHSISMISAIEAEWIEIGGKNYDINIVPLTQGEATARCIRFGGKLFEPKDAKTNKDVFLQAGGIAVLPSTAFWIGVSDIGEEDSF